MALYIPSCDLLILLPAKCGSSWLRQAVCVIEDDCYSLGPLELRGHGGLGFYGRDFSNIAAFVRHPYEWHVSYWNYRTSVLGHWEPERAPVDRICGNLRFAEYLQCVYSNFPNRVADYYSRFIGPANDRIDFIGKLENIANDFSKLLTDVGVRFDLARIQNVPAANVQSNKVELSYLRNLVFNNERNLYSELGYQC